MSTIKSSAENLTLNADGANNDVIIQSNASTKVTVDGATGNVGIGDTDPSEAKLSIDNVASGDAGLKIKQAQAQNGLLIDQNGNSHAIYIDSAASTGDGIRVEASSLTTSSAAHFYSGGANTSTRNLVHIHNDHASATGTTALYVKQDSTGLAADFIGAGGIRSASGIKFGTDTAAANTLNDYEEGTFTPTCSNLNVSLTSAEGSYTKVGRLVTFGVKIDFQGTTDGSNFLMAGLPFTVGDHQNNRGAVSIGYVNESTSNRVLLWQGTDRIEMYTAAGANITYQTLSNKDLYLGGSYYV